MNQPKTGLLFFFSIMGLFGCITPEYIPYDNSSRESKEENFVVKVYNREQLIENDYKIIGKISVEG